MNEDERAIWVLGRHSGLLPLEYGGNSSVHLSALRERAAEGLRERFPLVRCWWGPYTRHWWAYVPGTDLLIEADGPEQLSEKILRVLVRPPRM